MSDGGAFLFLALGEWGEILVNPRHIVAIESVAKLDRAGHPMLPPRYEKPTFDGCTIRMDTGNEILVPQSADVVADLMVEAL